MGPARASRQFPMTHLGKRWIKDTVGQFLHTQTMVGIRNKKPAKHHTTHMVKVVFNGCNILWEIIISSRIPSFMCVVTSTAILAPTIFIKVAWPPRWHTRLNYGVQIVSLETEIKLKLYVPPNSQDQHRSVLQLAFHTESAGVLVEWNRPLNMANFYYTQPRPGSNFISCVACHNVTDQNQPLLHNGIMGQAMCILKYHCPWSPGHLFNPWQGFVILSVT